ncbi:MAG TPA: autotransporter domain-containing protein, partial [Rhizomicrobium sp.]
MSTHSDVLGTALRISKNGKLLAGVSCLALTIGFLASPALAADYPVTDDASLRAAIGTANTDGAASSTITLSNDVTMTGGNLPVATKDITIDSGSFTFLKAYATNTTNLGVVGFSGASAGTVTLKGTVTGISGGGNNNGQYALYLNGGTTVINDATATGGDGSGTGIGGGGFTIQNSASLTNNGSIIAGNSTGGLGGGGAFMLTGASFTNYGTLKGGNGTSGGYGVNMTTSASSTVNYGTITAGNGTTGAGGVGATVQSGSTFTNNGTLLAGNGATGGIGVNLGGPNATTTSTLINSGTIKGGDGSTTAGAGLGVNVHIGAGTIINSGTITGGNGAAAIQNIAIGVNLAPVSIINSGTIAAGSGQANAIVVPNASPLTLELHKGSVITGNVVGGTGANTLILGGDDSASFDVSTVGPQYQNFTSFQKAGNSTWSLTGTGSVATPWVISQGTLQLGDGTATGSIIGDVTDNANLAFNRSDVFTFANTITGTGSVTQVGGGTTIVTGTNTYTGPTTVTGGTLSVNGSIATSTVTVASGGTLGGNGTVGAATIQSGGNIAPGNSIGTLHINGAFTQAAGSVYQVEVDPTSNASDLILVNGAATIASGATMNVIKNPAGDYRMDAQYTVLTALGGVTGSYALTGQSAVSQYLALEEQQDANNVYLRVVQTGDPADAAQTGNQTQTATGTDSLPNTSDVGSAVLNTPDPGATRSAFDQLSGEALASAKSALVSGSLLVRDTTFDRLRDVFCASDETHRAGNRAACPSQSDKPTVWAQGFGSWGHVAGNGNAAALSQSVGGFLVGVDMPIYDWRVGYFGGFSRTDFSVNARSSSGNSNNYHVGAYGGTQWGDLGLRLGASYSWNDLATDRSVTVGTLSNDLRANYNAGTTQVFGELGQRFGFEQFTLEPFANVAYVNLRTGGFSETGGDAALTAKADTTEDTFTTLGVRPSTDISWGG